MDGDVKSVNNEMRAIEQYFPVVVYFVLQGGSYF